MIVTAALSSSWRPHLLVAGVAFVVGVVWPTAPPVALAEAPMVLLPTATMVTTTATATATATTTKTTTPTAPTVAFLAVGSSTDVWIEPVPAVGTGGLLGFRLASVRPGSAWQRAGLKDGDVVVSIDGEGVKDLSQVLTVLSGRPSCSVRFLRGERELTATLVLL